MDTRSEMRKIEYPTEYHNPYKPFSLSKREFGQQLAKVLMLPITQIERIGLVRKPCYCHDPLCCGWYVANDAALVDKEGRQIRAKLIDHFSDPQTARAWKLARHYEVPEGPRSGWSEFFADRLEIYGFIKPHAQAIANQILNGHMQFRELMIKARSIGLQKMLADGEI